ncbi:hypothetical protein SAMN05880582_107196 [Rhizobium sp. RU20A]|nr:hypothetical protein SAMN05880582_107196 [Rhizobium sp. RU20A]
MNNIDLRNAILEAAAAAGIDLASPAANQTGIATVLARVIEDEAKLPLDRVDDAAAFLGCEADRLMLPALRQFFSDDAIALIERALPSALTPAEETWLKVIRAAAAGAVPPPTRFARNMVRAMLAQKD